ncbi:MAG: Fe-S cluster assembly protein SufD [Melioribacteraceae bacterium]|nr:Fe-S cluster assembly protein SufD [Melioribacteraceae bacterium]MCF8354272.1 Fe-S cluster assembly protein SufD [Melioribacteraceae bacterium]MCF8394596.1 Fe-S cluster assembly protein SufD [Melioribacteraceae bacterium]MCF8419735.1 Fe-S cluster assembly protein SufD [Melioribacteraceae bacterium]
MNNKTRPNEWYVSNFEKFESKLNGQSESFVHTIRKDAINRLNEMEFPTTRDEEWKYTNVAPLLKNDFLPTYSFENPKINSEDLRKYIFENFECDILVFVNGLFNDELSKVGKLPSGAVVDSLNNVIKNNPDLIKDKFNTLTKVQNAFNALNNAYGVDGAVIFIPDGIILERPIQLVYLGGNGTDKVLSLPRNLIIAGKNAQAKILANYAGYGDVPYFTNTVTEIFADESAIIDYYKTQHENTNSYHIDRTDINQKGKSVFSHTAFSFGGLLVRSDINSELEGEFMECNYYGLNLARENQHVDTHTFVDHAKPNCQSNELYKTILDDKARGVFSGKIMVRQDAQKTNAYQSNKAVLLSKTATIDSKPQLEIYADDVKCSHGATVGSLDEEAYMYIRSRGIPDDLAKSMLIRAFANDVVDNVKIEEVKEQLNHLIFEHLQRVEITDISKY